MRDRLQVDFEQLVDDFTQPEVDRLYNEFKSHKKYFNQKSVIERLGEIGLPSISTLIRVLPFAQTKSARKDIYQLLEKFRKNSIPILIENCHSENAKLRKRAVEILGRLREASAIKVLTQLLEDTNSEVRMYAVVALSNIGDSSTLQPTINRVADTNTQVSKIAMISLAHFNQPEILLVFTRALAGNLEARRTAAFLIGFLCNKIPEQRYRYSYYYFVNNYGLFLYSKEDEDLHDLLGKMLNSVEGGLHEHITSSTIEALTDLLTDKDAQVRRNTAEALGNIGSPIDASALVKILNDEDDEVREKVIEALGKIGDVSAIKPLAKVLEDKNSSLREKTIEALGKLGDKSVTSLIINAFRDTSREVREAAITAVGNLRDKTAAPALKELLQDFHSDMDYFQRTSITTAVLSLSKLKDKTALPQISHILNNSKGESYFQGQIINALYAFEIPEAIKIIEEWYEKSTV